MPTLRLSIRFEFREVSVVSEFGRRKDEKKFRTRSMTQVVS